MHTGTNNLRQGKATEAGYRDFPCGDRDFLCKLVKAMLIILAGLTNEAVMRDKNKHII